MRGARPERALALLARRALGSRSGATLVAGVSGGPDSVGLALILDGLARSDGWDLVIGHVDHAVRASSRADVAVVLSVAARLGRRAVVRRLDVARDDEATLREARYAALASIAGACGASAVATAHGAEDQTETVLLALFRGAGLDGIAGMPVSRPLDDGVELVRPLLRATHADLAATVRAAGFPYALDPANAALRYRRVAVRDALGPLRLSFPGLDRAVARCAEIARAEIAREPRADARRAVRRALRALGAADLPFARIEAALDAGDSADARPGDRADALPGGADRPDRR